MVPGLRGVTRAFLGAAAAQPQQAGGQDGADLAEVGWEVRVGARVVVLHGATNIYADRRTMEQRSAW
jgi:hypothetical protein